MNNETLILVGLAAIFLTSNRGDHLLQNLGQQTQLNTAHSEIEAENTEASQALAAELDDLLLCS